MAIKNKGVQAGIALVLVAAIVLAGTFAWNSFNQSKVNVFTELIAHDVNLHDDFEGGPNKDVYVENSGEMDIFVRVKLTEYLSTLNRESLIDGKERGTAETEAEIARNWTPHNGDDAAELCSTTESNGPKWNDETFHSFYTWTMGSNANSDGDSFIYYKPATEEQKVHMKKTAQ